MDSFGVESFVEEVLLHRFPGETFKHGIKKTGQGIRFHCPYCGDTYKLGATPRGNLYLKTGRFKCFNGGCNVSVSLKSFVYKWANEYGISVEDIDFDSIDIAETGNTTYNNLVVRKDNTICDYLMDLDLYDKMPKLCDFKFAFSLRDVNNLPENSNVRKYLNDRCAYSIPDISRRVYADPCDDKIYLMNVDDKAERVLSYATRLIEYKKYIIHPYSDMISKMYPEMDITDTDKEFLDMISSYFNILNIDFGRPVNVAEGQFDSMFLDNYMAIQGVSKATFIENHIDSDAINLFFDYDEAGIKTTNDMMLGSNSSNYGYFKWDDIIEKLCQTFVGSYKDIKGIHDINELYKFLYKQLGTEFNVKDFSDMVTKYVKRFDRKKLAFNIV